VSEYLFLFYHNIMNRPTITLLFVLFITVVHSQQKRLPADLRQHNLTTYDASLFNPAFSAGRNNPESVAVWARWQWQGIDANPSTLFLNYTRALNERSAAGIGFFQHNTGIFVNTGAALNYAHTFKLNSMVRLAIGANIFGFRQKLADDRFSVDPNLPLPISNESNDFILQMAPGISLEVQRFTLSLTSENLLDYNFESKEGNTAKSDKVFMSLLSYDFPITLGSETNSFLRPSVYMRTLPGQSNQIGFYTHLNTDGYYGQVGYNNFYGYALGGGYTFFNRLTVGALMEIGTGASLQKETSFELMASYFLGTPGDRHKMVGNIEEDVNPLEEIELREEDSEVEEMSGKVADGENQVDEKKDAQKYREAEVKQQRKNEKKVRDSLAQVQKDIESTAKKEQKQLEQQAKETVKKQAAIDKANAQEAEIKRAETAKAEEQAKAKIAFEEAEKANKARKMDSITQGKNAEKLELQKEQQREMDSIAQASANGIRKDNSKPNVQVKQVEIITPQKGEKYEEIQIEDGLVPGFYLIANVFSTKTYFEAFKSHLILNGIQPLTFKRSKNGFNYVYLKRYNVIKEARAARDSKFGGKYSGDTWIFRVVQK